MVDRWKQLPIGYMSLGHLSVLMGCHPVQKLAKLEHRSIVLVRQRHDKCTAYQQNQLNGPSINKLTFWRKGASRPVPKTGGLAPFRYLWIVQFIYTPSLNSA